jgi:hypothetical protein
MTFDQYDFNFDADAMKKDLERVDAKPGQAKRSNKYLRLPDGECALTIRILPSKSGNVLPYASTRLHYINGRSFHCLRELESDGYWRGNCPICTYYNALYRKADAAKTMEEAEEIKEVARNFKPIERHYYNVIVREYVDPETGETKKNVGPLVASFGKSLQAKILRAYVGDKKFKEPPLGNISHPLTGRDFKIIKELVKDGTRKYPRYDASRFEEESVLGDDAQIENWLGSLWDLEAERQDEMLGVEELQDQIDIIQGKKADPSVDFDVDEFSLPKEFNNTSEVSSDNASEESSKVSKSSSKMNEDAGSTKSKSQSKKKSSSESEDDTSDAPFDVDLDDVSGIEMDADWVKDIQKAVASED